MSTERSLPALRPCPRCHAQGFVDGVRCELCHGDTHISYARAVQWQLELHDTEPEMPAVRPPDTNRGD